MSWDFAEFMNFSATMSFWNMLEFIEEIRYLDLMYLLETSGKKNVLESRIKAKIILLSKISLIKFFP